MTIINRPIHQAVIHKTFTKYYRSLPDCYIKNLKLILFATYYTKLSIDRSVPKRSKVAAQKFLVLFKLKNKRIWLPILENLETVSHTDRVD